MTGDSATSGTRHLAIDLGAGSGRVMAGEIRDGRVQLRMVGRFAIPMVRDSACRYQCWNLQGILSDITRYIEHGVDQVAIASLGVDSWAVDYVLLDQDRKQVGEAVCYRDPRTAGMMERVWGRMPASEIYRRTGIQFLPFNTLYQLAATAEQEPQWIERARHLLMIPDYLHFKLCGVLSNEYTNATTTQMCGLDGAWEPALVALAGLKQCLMQPPIAAGTILGEIQTGGGSAAVIAPAAHDTASAVAGTPLEGPGDAYISSGTWSLMGVESSLPITTEEARRRNFTNEGGICGRFRLLKNIAGMWPIQRICEEYGNSDFTSLIAAAAALPAWRVLINPNDPIFLNPPSMAETVRAYCRYTQQPEPQTVAELARCVFDSLALAYRSVKDDLELILQRKLRRIRIIGGGCQNRLLNQLCADACELPVTAGPVEASALGNLTAQMIALGVVRNLEAARDLIRVSFPMQEFLPSGRVPADADRCFRQLLGTPCRQEVPCL